MTIINIYDLWLSILSECNVQQGGQIRPQQDFQKWVNAIQNELFIELVAEYQKTQIISDWLAPFHKAMNVNVRAMPGFPYDLVVIPSTYENLAGLRIVGQKDESSCSYQPGLPIIDGDGKYTDPQDADYAAMIAQYAGQNLIETPIQIIDTNRWGNCLNHPKKGASRKMPKATQDSQGFKLAPKGISNVVVDYFKTPRACVFGYDIVNDTVIYNAGTSTQLEWTDITKPEFLKRLMKKYGLAVREELIVAATK